MFSTLSKREIVILATFNLSSTNAFNLDWSKILSFGKGLNVFHSIARSYFTDCCCFFFYSIIIITIVIVIILFFANSFLPDRPTKRIIKNGYFHYNIILQN